MSSRLEALVRSNTFTDEDTKRLDESGAFDALPSVPAGTPGAVTLRSGRIVRPGPRLSFATPTQWAELCSTFWRVTGDGNYRLMSRNRQLNGPWFESFFSHFCAFVKLYLDVAATEAEWVERGEFLSSRHCLYTLATFADRKRCAEFLFGCEGVDSIEKMGLTISGVCIAQNIFETILQLYIVLSTNASQYAEGGTGAADDAVADFRRCFRGTLDVLQSMAGSGLPTPGEAVRMLYAARLECRRQVRLEPVECHARAMQYAATAGSHTTEGVHEVGGCIIELLQQQALVAARRLAEALSVTVPPPSDGPAEEADDDEAAQQARAQALVFEDPALCPAVPFDSPQQEQYEYCSLRLLDGLRALAESVAQHQSVVLSTALERLLTAPSAHSGHAPLRPTPFQCLSVLLRSSGAALLSRSVRQAPENPLLPSLINDSMMPPLDGTMSFTMRGASVPTMPSSGLDLAAVETHLSATLGAPAAAALVAQVAAEVSPPTLEHREVITQLLSATGALGEQAHAAGLRAIMSIVLQAAAPPDLRLALLEVLRTAQGPLRWGSDSAKLDALRSLTQLLQQGNTEMTEFMRDHLRILAINSIEDVIRLIPAPDEATICIARIMGLRLRAASCERLFTTLSNILRTGVCHDRTIATLHLCMLDVIGKLSEGRRSFFLPTTHEHTNTVEALHSPPRLSGLVPETPKGTPASRPSFRIRPSEGDAGSLHASTNASPSRKSVAKADAALQDEAEAKALKKIQHFYDLLLQRDSRLHDVEGPVGRLLRSKDPLLKEFGVSCVRAALVHPPRPVSGEDATLRPQAMDGVKIYVPMMREHAEIIDVLVKTIMESRKSGRRGPTSGGIVQRFASADGLATVLRLLDETLATTRSTDLIRRIFHLLGACEDGHILEQSSVFTRLSVAIQELGRELDSAFQGQGTERGDQQPTEDDGTASPRRPRRGTLAPAEHHHLLHSLGSSLESSSGDDETSVIVSEVLDGTLTLNTTKRSSEANSPSNARKFAAVVAPPPAADFTRTVNNPQSIDPRSAVQNFFRGDSIANIADFEALATTPPQVAEPSPCLDDSLTESRNMSPAFQSVDRLDSTVDGGGDIQAALECVAQCVLDAATGNDERHAASHAAVRHFGDYVLTYPYAAVKPNFLNLVPALDQALGDDDFLSAATEIMLKSRRIDSSVLVDFALQKPLPELLCTLQIPSTLIHSLPMGTEDGPRALDFWHPLIMHGPRRSEVRFCGLGGVTIDVNLSAVLEGTPVQAHSAASAVSASGGPVPAFPGGSLMPSMAASLPRLASSVRSNKGERDAKARSVTVCFWFMSSTAFEHPVVELAELRLGSGGDTDGRIVINLRGLESIEAVIFEGERKITSMLVNKDSALVGLSEDDWVFYALTYNPVLQTLSVFVHGRMVGVLAGMPRIADPMLHDQRMTVTIGPVHSEVDKSLYSIGEVHVFDCDLETKQMLTIMFGQERDVQSRKLRPMEAIAPLEESEPWPAEHLCGWFRPHVFSGARLDNSCSRNASSCKAALVGNYFPPPKTFVEPRLLFLQHGGLVNMLRWVQPLLVPVVAAPGDLDMQASVAAPLDDEDLLGLTVADPSQLGRLSALDLPEYALDMRVFTEGLEVLTEVLRTVNCIETRRPRLYCQIALFLKHAGKRVTVKHTRQIIRLAAESIKVAPKKEFPVVINRAACEYIIADVHIYVHMQEHVAVSMLQQAEAFFAAGADPLIAPLAERNSDFVMGQRFTDRLLQGVLHASSLLAPAVLKGVLNVFRAAVSARKFPQPLIQSIVSAVAQITMNTDPPNPALTTPTSPALPAGPTAAHVDPNAPALRSLDEHELLLLRQLLKLLAEAVPIKGFMDRLNACLSPQWFVSIIVRLPEGEEGLVHAVALLAAALETSKALREAVEAAPTSLLCALGRVLPHEVLLMLLAGAMGKAVLLQSALQAAAANLQLGVQGLAATTSFRLSRTFSHMPGVQPSHVLTSTLAVTKDVLDCDRQKVSGNTACGTLFMGALLAFIDAGEVCDDEVDVAAYALNVLREELLICPDAVHSAFTTLPAQWTALVRLVTTNEELEALFKDVLVPKQLRVATPPSFSNTQSRIEVSPMVSDALTTSPAGPAQSAQSAQSAHSANSNDTPSQLPEQPMVAPEGAVDVSAVEGSTSLAISESTADLDRLAEEVASETSSSKVSSQRTTMGLLAVAEVQRAALEAVRAAIRSSIVVAPITDVKHVQYHRYGTCGKLCFRMLLAAPTAARGDIISLFVATAIDVLDHHKKQETDAVEHNVTDLAEFLCQHFSVATTFGSEQGLAGETLRLLFVLTTHAVVLFRRKVQRLRTTALRACVVALSKNKEQLADVSNNTLRTVRDLIAAAHVDDFYDAARISQLLYVLYALFTTVARTAPRQPSSLADEPVAQKPASGTGTNTPAAPMGVSPLLEGTTAQLSSSPAPSQPSEASNRRQIVFAMLRTVVAAAHKRLKTHLTVANLMPGQYTNVAPVFEAILADNVSAFEQGLLSKEVESVVTRGPPHVKMRSLRDTFGESSREHLREMRGTLARLRHDSTTFLDEILRAERAYMSAFSSIVDDLGALTDRDLHWMVLRDCVREVPNARAVRHYLDSSRNVVPFESTGVLDDGAVVSGSDRAVCLLEGLLNEEYTTHISVYVPPVLRRVPPYGVQNPPWLQPNVKVTPSALTLLQYLIAPNEVVHYITNAFKVSGIECTPVLIVMTDYMIKVFSFSRLTPAGDIVIAERIGGNADASGDALSHTSSHNDLSLASQLRRFRDMTYGRRSTINKKALGAKVSKSVARFSETSPHRGLCWFYDLQSILEVRTCTYLHQNVGVQVQLGFDEGPMFAIMDESQSMNANARSAFVAKLQKVCERNDSFVLADDDHSREVLALRTESWRTRTISTYEYLTQINIAAGRFNKDWNQYPVFPWVLKQYREGSLDLTRPESFRDLAWPIHAQSDETRAAAERRFADMLSVDEDPCHHPTHYASSAAVLHFMLRVQPFLTMAAAFQGGRLDHADRLFRDVAVAFENASTTSADCKELIPDFYMNGFFLRNADHTRLGTTQTGEAVDDVRLPPWAQGSQRIFTFLMRQALESEHVSANIHHWVDMIFGVKQTGDGARKCLNVHRPLTYGDEVLKRLRKEETEESRNQIVCEVINFGQTPRQLFKREHPERLAAPEAKISVSALLLCYPKQVCGLREADHVLPLDYHLINSYQPSSHAITGFTRMQGGRLACATRHIVPVGRTEHFLCFSDVPNDFLIRRHSMRDGRHLSTIYCEAPVSCTITAVMPMHREAVVVVGTSNGSLFGLTVDAVRRTLFLSNYLHGHTAPIAGIAGTNSNYTILTYTTSPDDQPILWRYLRRYTSFLRRLDFNAAIGHKAVIVDGFVDRRESLVVLASTRDIVIFDHMGAVVTVGTLPGDVHDAAHPNISAAAHVPTAEWFENGTLVYVAGHERGMVSIWCARRRGAATITPDRLMDLTCVQMLGTNSDEAVTALRVGPTGTITVGYRTGKVRAIAIDHDEVRRLLAKGALPAATIPATPSTPAPPAAPQPTNVET